MESRLFKARRVSNTGKFSQYYNPAIMIGDILVPYNWSMAIAADDTDEDIQTNLKAALKSGLTADDPKQRMYFIGRYESLEDKSEGVKTQTLGYGKVVVTARGTYNFEHTFDEGGLEQSQKVQTFNGKIRQFKTIRIDEKGTVLGACLYGDDPAPGSLETKVATGIQGFELSLLNAPDWTMPNLQTEAKYGISIGIKYSSELNEDIYIIETGEDIASYVEDLGIQDIAIALVDTNTTAGTIDFVAKVGGINVTDQNNGIPDIVDPTLITVFSETANGSVAVTSATARPDGTIRVVVDTMDPNYNTGDSCYIKFKAPSVLAAADLKYYESNKVRFTMK